MLIYRDKQQLKVKFSPDICSQNGIYFRDMENIFAIWSKEGKQNSLLQNKIPNFDFKFYGIGHV